MPFLVAGPRRPRRRTGVEMHRGRIHGHVEAVLVAGVDADAAGDAAELLDGEGAILPRARQRQRRAASHAQAAEDARVEIELDRPAGTGEVRTRLARVAARGRARDEIAQRAAD